MHKIRIVLIVVLLYPASAAADTWWLKALDYQEATETASCVASTADSGLKVMIAKERDGKTSTLVGIGTDPYPGHLVVANVGGRIHKANDGVFGAAESKGLLLDMLVGEKVFVQWVKWPSREAEEREYSLYGLPYTYLACRKDLGLTIPGALVDRLESTLQPVLNRLSESFSQVRIETEGRLIGIEVVRKDGEQALLDLDAYFTIPAVSGLSQEEWLEQWIGSQLSESNNPG